MYIKKQIIFITLAVANVSAYAGDFVSLTMGVAGTLSATNGGLINGTNSPSADPLFIETTGRTFLTGFSDTTPFDEGGTGNVIESSIDYHALSNSGTLTLLDWRKTDNVTLLAGTPQATVYDFVYRDSADGKLVFGSRFLNRVANSQEFNYTYRYGFNGFTAAVAWTYMTDSDLRLYQAGRTKDFSFNTSVPFDSDAIRLKGDYNVTEGNPWSALNLVKTNANSYTLSSTGIGFYQAGEEGQPVIGNKIAGFVPVQTNGSTGDSSGTDAPLPNWALLLMTATLFAVKFKYDKRFS